MADLPAPASGDEGLPHGIFAGVEKALSSFLEQRQGRVVTRKKQANSSAGRARRNALAAISEYDLVRELVRRSRKEDQRVWRREYMRERRRKAKDTSEAQDG